MCIHTHMYTHIHTRMYIYTHIYIVFILGLFSMVLRCVALLSHRVAPVPTEVPFSPPCYLFLTLCCHFLYAAFRHQYPIVFRTGVSPYVIVWPILYHRDYNGSLTHLVVVAMKTDIFKLFYHLEILLKYTLKCTKLHHSFKIFRGSMPL